jgi:hypothetical protein
VRDLHPLPFSLAQQPAARKHLPSIQLYPIITQIRYYFDTYSIIATKMARFRYYSTERKIAAIKSLIFFATISHSKE